MNLYYENHLGERIYFFRSPYILTEHDLFNWVMSYSTVNNKSSGYKFDALERNVTIRIMPRAQTGEARAAMFADLVDDFVRIVSADKNTMGKIWTDNGEYLVCKFISCEKTEWNIPRNVTLTCRLRSDNPIWQHSDNYQVSFTDETEYQYLDYPHDFAYDYKGLLPGYKEIENGSTETADYILTIKGPATNPKIMINGISVGAYVALGSAQTLVINTKTKSVTKISGAIEENHFNDRYKGEVSMFTKLPPGPVSLLWSGLFGFDLEVIEERREPAWN